MSSNTFSIDGRNIGLDSKPYIIAELSANHNGSKKDALKIIDAAAESGADAIKLQHYLPETMTVRSNLPEFKISGGTLWDGQQLFDLYAHAMTPWEWTGELIEYANNKGLVCFSTPFDTTAVDFLEQHDVPAYKVASFELIDIPLIEYIAKTGKPIIMSTGMATVEEIDNAVHAVRSAGNSQLALLRCNSGYPATPSEMDLNAIPYMRDRWECEIGLSDHTLDVTSAIVAVAMGATIIEKHLTIDRRDGGPDAEFSCEPSELDYLVECVNDAWVSKGAVRFGPSERELSSRAFRRSLRTTRNLCRGDVLSRENIASMRPAGGLAPLHVGDVIGKKITRDLEVGSAVTWDVLED